MNNKIDKNIIIKVAPSIIKGNVKISGAKNSALKLLVASLLTDENIYLFNFPSKLYDILVTMKMLQKLGKKFIYKEDYLKIESSMSIKSELNWEEEDSVRITTLILGALLARNKYGKVPLPGGCKIGERKYDLHIMILEKMGAKIWEEGNYILGEAPKGLFGTEIKLPIRSTGATELAIISSTLAKGKTVIYGPHIRPEILDLISLLNRMGAKIYVRGQESIIIEGVNYLHSTFHNVIPDNVEALTYVISALITKGEIEIQNFPYENLEVPLVFLRESGGIFYKNEFSFLVKGKECYPIEISTGPYPGINSDMQPLFAVIGMKAKGVSKIIDLRFPGRYNYISEFQKMGGVFTISDNILTIIGPCELKGTTVCALDLRCGAALILAGLIAEGETRILNAWQILRGYEDIDKKFQQIGGKVYIES
ncbi:MAG: UDP-N-acetylglucosamine 1-carboxyvinyltransferase [Candidatus Ratteibacteria bacterium]